MKKTTCIMLMGLLLAMVLTTSAMAASTAVQYDDKAYTFHNSDSTDGTYVIGDTTFIIKGDQVTIRQNGKPDEVHQLHHSSETAKVVEKKVEVVQGTSTDISVVHSSNAPIYATSEATSVVGDTSEITSVAVYDATAAGLADQSENYAIYTQYGLSFDETNGAFYYQGKRVRVFEDGYPLDNQYYCAIEKVDLKGTIDIRAQRDVNYQLTGLYVLNQEDFSSRVIRVINTYLAEATTAVESGSMTLSEKKETFDAYAHLGLTYDVSTDILTYQGKTVREFTDIQQSNGEAINSGRFTGTIIGLTKDFGVIDVVTVRDYTKLDADGNGTLTGLTVTSVK